VIPFLDLRRQHAPLKPELMAALARVVDGSQFVLGGEGRALETDVAAVCGVAHAVGVGSGTDALRLALTALDIGAGDEVITPAFSFVASATTIMMTGATPVLVDIDESTFCMSPRSLEATIAATKGRLALKAVVPVHLYGQPADLTAICRIAADNGLLVLEDCAQAHGAAAGGRKVGTFGDAAAFSFYPTKNLGALGDGGLIVTSREDVAEEARVTREYGWRKRYISDQVGVNSRLDELQAALLRVMLRHLEADNERRRRIAGRYASRLAGSAFTLPAPIDSSRRRSGAHRIDRK